MKSDYPLTPRQVDEYRQNGFIRLDDVITGNELAAMRSAVAAAVAEETAEEDPNRTRTSYDQIFIQKVNLWTRHDAVRPFALARRFGTIAARLMGTNARLWHDQALFKEARTGAKTPWHQDTPYWPHEQKQEQLSIWIALSDATLHNGCMSFIPRTHKLRNVEMVNLADPQELFAIAPEVRGTKAVTCELKAGSCTVHNGLTFHYAGPNRSDAMREAFVLIYMPDGTTYNGAKHMVTDPLNLKVGQPLIQDLFPLVSDLPKTGSSVKQQ
jgi:phytanoyl-CoA hydroxylase